MFGFGFCLEFEDGALIRLPGVSDRLRDDDDDPESHLDVGTF